MPEPTAELVQPAPTAGVTRPEADVETPPEPVAATVGAGGSPLSLVDVRRLWPDIVEATKQRRRVTWIHLTQHAQVVAVDGEILTLGFGNLGARESFDNGGSAEIVRQAAIDVVGHDWRVETIVDPGADPEAAPPPPAAEQVPTPAPEPTAAPVEPPPFARPVEPAQPVESPSATARQAIAPTRTTSGDDAAPAGPADSDGGARPDDADAESSGLDGAQLLQEALGAQVIEEIPHQ
jgi:DNA polymerase-3 subunit gamma/tau